VGDTVATPNSHVIDSVLAALETATISDAIGLDTSTADPRTELDSHANMVVLGSHAFVFEKQVERVM
jgi:hypothetical protein